jgi:leader peptidase (prepilin peptidase)/N-methyltransferase
MFAGLFINDLTITQRIIGCICCLIPFLLANILSGDRLGMGDVKLVGAFGFVLGVYGGLTAAVAGLILMLLAVSAAGIARKIKQQNKAVPLAPFLCSGFALILLTKGIV